jgi:hypothetical protein
MIVFSYPSIRKHRHQNGRKERSAPKETAFDHFRLSRGEVWTNQPMTNLVYVGITNCQYPFQGLSSQDFVETVGHVRRLSRDLHGPPSAVLPGTIEIKRAGKIEKY